MKPSNSTISGAKRRSITYSLGPRFGSISKVTPVLRVSKAGGVAGVTGKPPAPPPPEATLGERAPEAPPPTINISAVFIPDGTVKVPDPDN